MTEYGALVASVVLKPINHFHTVNSRCHRSLRFLVLLFIGQLGELGATEQSPPKVDYVLRNPRPGQLDANHWQRQRWVGPISNVAVLPGGRLLVSSAISAIHTSGTYGFTNLAVLNRYGWVDTGAPRFIAAPPFAMAAQPDGHVALALAGGTEVRFLDADFAPDPRWRWPPEDRRQMQHAITGLRSDDDGNWLVWGVFGNLWAVPAIPFVDRIRPDGVVESILETAAPALFGDVVSTDLVHAAGEGRLLAAFRHRVPNSTSIRTKFVRLLRDGSQDPGFIPAGDWQTNRIRDVALSPDGSMYVAYLGTVTTKLGVVYRGLCRLNPNGSVDATFGNQFTRLARNTVNHWASSLLVDSKNRVLVGGSFELWDRGAHRGVVRLFGDGSLDRSFLCGEQFLGTVTSLQWDSQGRAVVFGRYTVSDTIESGEVDPPLAFGISRTQSFSDLAVVYDSDRDLAAPPGLTNGVFSVESYLPESAQLILERSADMVHWQGFRTNFAAGTNWMRTSFPVGEADSGEFYRVSVRP